MSASYKPVLWNPQKKRYDLILAAGALVYLVLFAVVSLKASPPITAETLIIRATGSLAFVLLHLILVIGPACRIDDRLLPLLYNRRHLGVFTFLIALVHGVFNLIQFHALGDVGILQSLFGSNTHYDELGRFPFQVLGFMALLILLAMAASSHDFWLKNLGPGIWKAIHMSVYVAYGLLVGHVLLGVVQLEKASTATTWLGLGMFVVIGVHLYAAFVTRRRSVRLKKREVQWQKVCRPEAISPDRAKVVYIGKESIAIFRHDKGFSAVSNVCKHQMGPLGEGKVVDGCITCPWHGYQYQPEDGKSPPPFTEKLATYPLMCKDGFLFVDPEPQPEGTFIPALQITSV